MRIFSCPPRRPIGGAASAARGAGQFYPRFSYSFARGVPAGFSRSWTIDFDLRRWSGRVV